MQHVVDGVFAFSISKRLVVVVRILSHVGDIFGDALDSVGLSAV